MRGSFIQSDTVTKPKILLVVVLALVAVSRGGTPTPAPAGTSSDTSKAGVSTALSKEYNDAILQDDYTSAARAFQKSADQLMPQV